MIPMPPLPPLHPTLSCTTSQPTALIFGNERLGVSTELLAVCDGTFTIPMYGLTESLNVSVAAAVALHFGRVARAAARRAMGL